METKIRPAVVGCLLVAMSIGAVPVEAQDERVPIDEEGRVVDFQRDIAPILSAHCYECHSGDQAKADFRIHESDSVLMYVEPEDAESSMLYADYLVSTDDTMMMPPRTHGGPLAPSQLALIRLWIEEGADWPEDATVAGPAGQEAAARPAQEATPEVARPSLARRVWAFQGYFHPATVHFPIALLMLGALFVVLGWRWPSVGTQVPLACLILGSISAVVASIMGWSFAAERGWSQDVTYHRWSGTVLAALSVLLAMIAVVAATRRRQARSRVWTEEAGKSQPPEGNQGRALDRLWKGGLVVLAMGVGLVGHQGGELTYGSNFYNRAFERLWGPVEQAGEDLGEAVQETLEQAAP